MTPDAWRTLSHREQRQWLGYWAGKRSNRWIARQIGCAPHVVPQRCHRYGVAPTRAQGCITAYQAAAVLNRTPQTVSKYCRQGKLRAHRNLNRRRWEHPVRRQSTPWWMIRLDDLAEFAGVSVGEIALRLAEFV